MLIDIGFDQNSWIRIRFCGSGFLKIGPIGSGFVLYSADSGPNLKKCPDLDPFLLTLSVTGLYSKSPSNFCLVPPKNISVCISLNFDVSQRWSFKYDCNSH